jgi:hypothetical protein
MMVSPATSGKLIHFGDWGSREIISSRRRRRREKRAGKTQVDRAQMLIRRRLTAFHSLASRL